MERDQKFKYNVFFIRIQIGIDLSCVQSLLIYANLHDYHEYIPIGFEDFLTSTPPSPFSKKHAYCFLFKPVPSKKLHWRYKVGL